MINTITMNNSPARTIHGKVELYNGSTLAHTFTHDGNLVSIDVDRVGEEGKFFGFGVSQKAVIKVNDKQKQLNINDKHSLKIFFNSEGGEFATSCPTFYVSEVKRDENTNQLTITAYDAVYLSGSHKVSELNLKSPYDIAQFATACASLLGVGIKAGSFDVSAAFHAYVYENGANFNGSESIRQALNAVAEATQTIYFINHNDELVFVAFTIDSVDTALKIEKSDYFTLESEEAHTITGLAHATELGDNVIGGFKSTRRGEFLALSTSKNEHNLAVSVSSKNLIPYPYTAEALPKTVEGITFTDNGDGGIIVNGTATGFALYRLTMNNFLKAGKTYALGGRVELDTGAIGTHIAYRDAGVEKYGSSFFTWKDEYTFIQCYIQVTPNTVCNNVTVYPYVELGSTPTGYTPYVADLTPVTITRCGKNLVPNLGNKTVVSNGVTFSPADNGGIAVSGAAEAGAIAIAELGSIKAPTKTGYITVSLTGEFENIVTDFKILNKNGTLLRHVQTTTKETVYLNDYPTAATWVMGIKRLATAPVSGTVYYQVERGIGATAYEPYNAQKAMAMVGRTINTITSIPDETRLYTDTDGVVLEATYYVSESEGETQYVRDNPFWELRPDITDAVDAALAQVIGATLQPFKCSWRGNFLLEPCDLIQIAKKDSGYVWSAVINDSFSYNGGFSQNTSWSFEETKSESLDNPTSIGDVINKTSAKVDKINQEITLEINSVKNDVSQLKIDKDSILATVSQVAEDTQNAIEGANEEISKLTESVNLKMDSEKVSIEIQKQLENGVTKVTTTNNYTFDDKGLNISKEGDGVTTQITNNGMSVYRDETEVLTANDNGVDAINLHATTYLTVGTNSRFENYNDTRTGCFWIGG